MVSNVSPHQCPIIWDKPELREKIIPLKFDYPIPQNLMFAGLRNELAKMAHFFFMWAVFCPRSFLVQQTRSKVIRSYQESVQ